MNNKSKGILYIIISAFGFAAMGIFVKLAGDVPSIEKTFYRNLVSLVLAFILTVIHKESFFGKRENQKYLLARSILGAIGTIASFYAIDNLVLSDATMLNKLSPFFVIIFSFLFLKEKIKPSQAVALIVAFSGSLFIIKPGFSSDIFPSLIGLASAVFAGAAYTFVRFLGGREKFYTIVFYFSFISILSVLPFLIFVYEPLTLSQFLYLMGAGIFASISQFSLTAAYKYSPASEISIYDYTQILFAAILGFLFLKEVPDSLSIVGYILIISASIGIFLYNSHKAKKLKDKF
ncbi:DMT family transporter [Clostridium polynesiense]|uniref:DMT family transporter n=1 Tax=Clostridium polynesiense TaxID=1325933 RepID=UPI00058FDD65|nr:DMT family transporter [Clostridium polynesiense]